MFTLAFVVVVADPQCLPMLKYISCFVLFFLSSWLVLKLLRDCMLIIKLWVHYLLECINNKTLGAL